MLFCPEVWSIGSIRSNAIEQSNEVWRSLVARLVRDQEVVGSSPVTSTKTERKHFCFRSVLHY